MLKMSCLPSAPTATVHRTACATEKAVIALTNRGYATGGGHRDAESAESSGNPHPVCFATDLYNGSVTGNKCCSLNANTGASANHAGPSVILTFIGGQGARARSIALCADGTTPTLKSVLSGGNTVPDICYRRTDE